LDRFLRSALFPLIVIVLLVYLASETLLGDDGSEKIVSYAEVQQLVRDAPERIDTVTFRPNVREVVVKLDNGTRLRARYPATKDQRALERMIVANSGTGNSESNGSSGWWTILTALLPFVLLFGFWVHLMNRTQRRRSSETLIPDAKDFRSDAANQ
jgi:cell division protease FtsH